MATPDTYVPILKGKQGEFDALRKLLYGCRRKITPLIEMLPQRVRTTKANAGKPQVAQKTLEELITYTANKIAKCWSYAGCPLTIDARYLGDVKGAAALVPLVTQFVIAAFIFCRQSDQDGIRNIKPQFLNWSSAPSMESAFARHEQWPSLGN